MDSNIIIAISLGLLALYMIVRLVTQRQTNSVVLKSKIQAGAVVIDVRSQAEFGDGHYPNALNIPVDELENRLSELGGDTSQSIIVYCASGARSAKAARLLKNHGYTNVVNAGGLFNLPR